MCDKNPIFYYFESWNVLWRISEKILCFQKETSKWFMCYHVMENLLAHPNSLTHGIICQLFKKCLLFLNLFLKNNYFPNHQHLVSVFVSDILEGFRTAKLYLRHCRIYSVKECFVIWRHKTASKPSETSPILLSEQLNTMIAT